MRLLTTAGIGVLSLLLGIPAVSAQEDKPKTDEAKPEASPDTAKPAQQAPADQDKQQMKQDQNNLPKDDKQTKEEKKEEKDAAKAAKENGGAAPTGTQPNAHPANGQSSNGQAANAHAANGQSGRIPDKDFKAHFGKQHTFVVNQPVIVQGQPRFQYSGYWFVISDPWPVGWAYTDSCYIDYIDGEYFLFDLLHPGVQIALVVVVA
jgi:hypothetical protein